MSDGARVAPGDSWGHLVDLVRSFRASVQRAQGGRINSSVLRGSGKELVQHYFRFARPELDALGLEGTEQLDELMRSLLESTNGRTLKKTYLSVLAKVQRSLAEIEGQRELRIGQRQMVQTRPGSQVQATVTAAPSETESRIIGALDRLVPSASLSYRQALADLSNRGRISFRGTANELREALREVIDELAPDEDVMGVKGFRLVSGQTKPTRKQKVRYILKSQGVSGTGRGAPERAVELIEELVTSFATSTYDRSNVTAHVASARRDFMQLKMYLDGVLAELLQIHG
jgi:Predicted pPIWI-associating nuclease